MAENEFGRRVRGAREHLRLSRRELAEKLDYSMSALQSLEEGRTQPSVQTLADLAKVFGWDYGDALALAVGETETHVNKDAAGLLSQRPILAELLQVARHLAPEDLARFVAIGRTLREIEHAEHRYRGKSKVLSLPKKR